MDRALEVIAMPGNKGSEILLDGRGVKVPGYENGNWLGPTIIDHVEPGMPIYDNELFSPVMLIVRRNTLQEAIDFVNSSKYGNGLGLFTRSGGNARKF